MARFLRATVMAQLTTELYKALELIEVDSYSPYIDSDSIVRAQIAIDDAIRKASFMVGISPDTLETELEIEAKARRAR